ncbi:6009_t:CDS:2, partial [Cetraspora pellucida]
EQKMSTNDNTASNTNDTITLQTNDSTTIITNVITTLRTNSSNIPNTVYPVTSTLPNLRPSQRTFNSNCQSKNRRNRYDDPDYDPDKKHDLNNYM